MCVTFQICSIFNYVSYPSGVFLKECVYVHISRPLMEMKGVTTAVHALEKCAFQWAKTLGHSNECMTSSKYIKFAFWLCNFSQLTALNQVIDVHFSSFFVLNAQNRCTIEQYLMNEKCGKIKSPIKISKTENVYREYGDRYDISDGDWEKREFWKAKTPNL